MSLVLAAAYVGSAVALLAGASLRRDRRIAARLGASGPAPASPYLVRIGARMRVPLPALVSERATELELGEEEIAAIRARKMLFALLGAAIGALAGLPAAILGAPLLAVAGFRIPDVQLARAVTARRRGLAAAVPQLLDVLAVSVSAGLSPRLALDRAHAAVSGRLRDELVRAGDDVVLGAPMRTVLRRLAERTHSRDLRRLAVVLDRAERLGAPVADRLQALARDVRSERRSRREQRAHRAPIHMLFPLVFLILPAFVVAAVIPAVLVATRGLS